MGRPIEDDKQIIDGKKLCRKCDQWLDVSLFSRQTDRKGGYQTYCKKCMRSYSKTHVKGDNRHGLVKNLGEKKTQLIVFGHNYRAKLYDKNGNQLSKKYYKYPPNFWELLYLFRMINKDDANIDFLTAKGDSIKDKTYRVNSTHKDCYIMVERITDKKPTIKELLR